MAQAGAIEVPLRLRPEAVIPFHEGETIRLEMGRTTLVGPPDVRVAVRCRDCDVIVDGNRLHGVQSAVIVDHPDGTRALGFILKIKTDLAAETSMRLDQLLAGMEAGDRPLVEAHLLARHPETGEVIRTFTLHGTKIVKHAVHTVVDEIHDPPLAGGDPEGPSVKVEFETTGLFVRVDLIGNIVPD